VMELVNMPIDRVVPMPHLPPAVRGVYNWRGEILWIVDLAMLLGADGASRRDRSLQPTIVLGSITDRVGIAQLPPVGSRSQPQQPQKTIGLIVDEIVEIEWCQLDLIGSTVPADLDPALSKWVRGMWESPTGENFLVLDGQAILERADVHADV
jgi:positive phototaxis protein PixI